MFYIGKFLHMTNQQETEESERRHGEFNLIIQAEISASSSRVKKAVCLTASAPSILFIF
jgi:hypothetical protein